MAGSNETFNVTIGANMDVGGVLGAVKQMQGAFNGLKMPANLTGNILKDFDKLRESLNKFKSITDKGVTSKTDLKNLDKLQKEIDSTFTHLSNSFDELSGKTIYLDADLTRIKNARAEVEQLRNDLKNKLGDIKIEMNMPKGGSTSIGINQIIADMERGVKSSKVLSAEMRKVGENIQLGNFSAVKDQLTEIEAKASSLKGASAGLLDTFKQWGIIDFKGQAKDISDMTTRAALLKSAFEKIKNGISGDEQEVKKLVIAIDDAVKEVERLETIGKANAAKPINEAKNATDQLATSAHNAAQAEKELGQATLSASDQVKQLQQSTQYFFSLRNMINLLKRGIDEAVQSVKDLDKAMTETAVVTDYKVSDLWGMLPEYTKIANQLGATTQGAYETMTLYYQQGLNQQQAFELGAETMKMARIAGLDYAETTDMMTAALRGFNMELNEVSAKRVNDVYSELAAITASDTEELGTAMQRTASIAHSAGMSFEGTTAFLAQAIETTREPAENIGTAMKTIVARFQEMKKNPLEIVDVEGEEVSYNKVDQALQSIGVSLKDTNGQFRALDDVFLDISARWDSLTQTQQRYIATTAAGSRQQSRFIAMMDNYERTVQLVDAANNSAGASEEQFGKTMDSLESKLNKLHNAWQAFTMGIANNAIIKTAVDGLTTFLTVTNKIIDTLSLGSGVVKSFLSVFAAFTGLKVAGRVANRAIGGLGGLIDPKSSFKEGFRGGALKQGQNVAQAKAISTPIVNTLEKISGQVAAIAKTQGVKEAGQKGQSTAGTKETSKEEYKQTKRAFDQLNRSEGFKMSEASALFGKLDAKHQLSMFNNNPGTKMAMQRAHLQWFNSKDLSKELTIEGKGYIRSIYKGMSEGQIPVNEGIKLIGQPQKWGEYFGTETAQAFSQNYKQSIQRSPEELRAAGLQALQEISDGMLDADMVQNLKDPLERAAKDPAFKQAFERILAEGDESEVQGIKGKVSTFGTFTNTVGALGDKFTQTGYAISSFGSVLSQLGGPLGAVGSAMQSFGGILSSVGMGLSSMMNVLPAFKDGIQSINAATGEATTLISAGTLGMVAALAGAVIAGVAIAKKQLKDINDAAQEVSDTYKETSDQTQQNISNLKSYRDEFTRLSKGVDSNGNNVNLDTTDYDRYLEIVDEIAKINPDIVEGYNAQGHAIINNNKALVETLKLEEQRQKTALDNYTSEESLNKLIKARNYSTGFGKAVALKDRQSQARLQKMYGDVSIGMEREGGNSLIIPMQTAVQDAAKKLQNESWFDESTLKKYGIESLDALINGEEEAVNKFVKYQDKINEEVSSAADVAGEEMGEALVKSFDKLGEKTASFNEAIEPIYQNLATQFTQSPFYESIGTEFRSFALSGLKEIASQDWDANTMISETNKLAIRFANLTSESSDYSKALDTVEKAQQDFAATLNETEYKAEVQPAIDELVRLKEEALKEGSVYGSALAEYLETQIQQIARFTEEGTTTIQEGLNTATDAIAEAESALENFNKSTEKDFWTAAEGMRSIYDKIFETYKDSYGTEKEKHTWGEGDNTFWTGAEYFLSEKELTGGVDKVAEKIKDLEPTLRDGREGVEAFYDLFTSKSQEALKDLKDKGVELYDDGWIKYIPEDQWSNVAEAMGWSEEYMTSMLNKARQLDLISFDNLTKVREGIATSNLGIAGIDSNKAGQKELYMKEDTMRRYLREEGGYNTKESQDKIIEQLANEQNVHMVKTMDNLTNDMAEQLVKAWDITDLSDLITKMNETGDYNKEEILDLAEKAGLGSGETASDTYDAIIRALDNPELAAQTSELQSINAKLDAIVEKETGKGVEEHEAQYEEAHEASLGENGIATNFAKGLDAEGKVLDTGSFAVVRDELEATEKQYQEAAEYYKQRAAMADDADKAHFDKLAEKYKKDAETIKQKIKEGEDYKKKLKQDAESRRMKGRERQEDPKKTEAPALVQPLPKKEAEKVIESAQDKGKRDTEHYQAIMDLKEGPSFKKTEKKLTHWEEEQLGIDADIQVEGADQLDTAEKSVLSLQDLLDSPFGMFIDANFPLVSAALQTVQETQATAAEGANLETSADTSAVDAAGSTLTSIAKTYYAKLQASQSGLGGILTTLGSIWSRIKDINNTPVKAGGGRAAGQNNYIPHSSIPLFGSAARGRYGTVGPKNKGGLTLTGEKGFEIAWLPSENRSMILGAGGPQMLNLPADAVVYTHEQSKDILKRKSIPAGSHKNPTTKGKKLTEREYSSTNDDDTGDTGDNGKGKGNNNKTVKLTNKLEITTGKIYGWWDNIERKVDRVNKTTDKLGKQLTKTFNDIRASIGEVNKVNKQFIDKNNQLINLSQKEYDTARAGLSSKQYNKLSLASKAITSKTSKAEKNRIKAARKELGISRKTAKSRKEAIDAERKVTVSWKSPKKVKSGKNKGKLIADKTVDVEKEIDVRKYYKYDKSTGTYKIDYNKINADSTFSYKTKNKGIKKTEVNKDKADAILKATETYLNNMQDRKDTAEENITKAQDEIANYRKEIDDTFFGWKNELTKIYKITGEIEKIEARINKARSQYNYAQTLLNQQDLSFGMTKEASDYLKQMKEATARSKEYYQQEINSKKQLIEDTKNNQGLVKTERALYGALTDATVKYVTNKGTVKTTTEKQRYNQLRKITSNGSGQGWDELSENDKKIFARGTAFERGYIKQGSDGSYILDTSAIERARQSGQITSELYELIKETYDTLHQYDLDLINVDTEILDLTNEQLQAELEYENTVKSIAEQLYGWKNTLTKILQLTTQIEQAEKRTALLQTADSYYEAKRNAGYGNEVNSTQVLSAYVGQLASTINQIQGREKLIAEQRQDLKDYIAGNDLKAEIERFTIALKKNPTDDTIRAGLENLTKEAQYRAEARNYVKTTPNADGTYSVVFDSDKLERAKIANGNSVGTEYYQKIEEYAQEIINKNNELAETIASQATSVTELYSSLSELKQAYANSAKELREAYSAQQQQIVDNIKTLYSSIDNNFKTLINQVKQNIQQRRQAEDNAKTEADISKKQQRLAMLRADTAGGNKTAIAQLEREIADAQQSYGRTLEDQMLDKLSQQGDEAAKQREQQVQLMQAQRDIAQKTGQDAAKINEWLHDPGEHEDEIKTALRNTDGWSAMTEAERRVYDPGLETKIDNYKEVPDKIGATEQAIKLLGSTEIPNVEKEFETATYDALKLATAAVQKGLTDGLAAVSTELKEIGKQLGVELTSTQKAIAQIKTDTDNAIKKLQNAIDAANAQIDKNKKDQQAAENFNKIRDALIEDPTTLNYKEALAKIAEADKAWANLTEDQKKFTNYDNRTKLLNKAKAAEETAKANQIEYDNFLTARGSETNSGDKNWGKISDAGFNKQVVLGQTLGLSAGEVAFDLAKTKALTWRQILTAAEKAGFKEEEVKTWRSYCTTDNGKNSFGKAFNTAFDIPSGEGRRLQTNFPETDPKKKKYEKYKIGGLNTYTGPAWLDGTPSKPELVLNAKDTKNFLALRDVLNKALGSTSAVNNSYGGDATYEININVDHLNSDYDVDKVAERVKKIIVKDSSYRNVTQVRNFR